MADHAESGKTVYLRYAKILGVLAFLTVTMIFIGESGMSQGPKAMLLLLGSSIKATLIVFYFMHLKFENFGLILTVLVGIFVTSFLMFVVPSYDAGQVLLRSLYK